MRDNQNRSFEIAKSLYTDVYKSTTFSPARLRIERFHEINVILDKHAKNKAKILDFGGGDGELFNFIAAKYQYWLIDIASSHKINKSLKRGQLLAFSEDWEIPKKDNYFDVIILSEVLEHIPNPFLALQEIKRVLRDNGTLIITVPNAYNIFYIALSLFGKYIDPSKEHVVLYDYSHLNNLAQMLNLKLIRSYTKFFFLGRLYGKYLFWADPLLSRIFPHNNMQLFTIFKNIKK